MPNLTYNATWDFNPGDTVTLNATISVVVTI
jgi:hypothetical protein